MREDVADLEPALGQADRQRLDEHLTSVRDLERAISSLPPDYGKHIEQQRILRDICRWHVGEFAYLLERMRSLPEGDGNLPDHTCWIYVHEHAEANPHKCNGLAILLAGGAGKMKTGMHTKSHHSIGDVIP